MKQLNKNMADESKCYMRESESESTSPSFDSFRTKSEKSSEEGWRERYIVLLDDIDRMLDALLNVINDL